MAKNLCVKIEHSEVIEQFRQFVTTKHGQYMGYFGKEIEKAMVYWIEINRDLIGEKNSFDISTVLKNDTSLPKPETIKLLSKQEKRERAAYLVECSECWHERMKGRDNWECYQTERKAAMTGQ